MTPSYKKLVSLASEVDAASTPEKIDEINTLLSSQKITYVEDQHLSLVDDLICILKNTDNIDPVNHDAIIRLQEVIRHRLSQSK